jgi:N-acetylmuramoyl-L-alanine amidase
MRLVAAGALCALALVARGAEPLLVVLDPGHGPARPGAIGVRGRPEVEYNDAFVALLRARLEAAGFRVELTRGPAEEAELGARAARASDRGAWLLLSIHHDSAQLRYLEERPQGGRPAFRTTRPIRGWSLFFSGLNARREDSLRVARALGRRLVALGRPPTLHHAEPIPGEGRPLVDAALGIYRFDELKVVREARCPAVLVGGDPQAGRQQLPRGQERPEVGVLVDEVDEAYVSDPARRAALVDAVVQGLQDARER